MAYALSVERTYPEYWSYEGLAGYVEAEFQGIPGLSGPIRWAIEEWAGFNRLTLLSLKVWQDTAPIFDRYKIELYFHDSPIAWAVIIPLLIKAIMALGLGVLAWKVTEVMFKPAGQIATTIKETAQKVAEVAPEKIPELAEKAMEAFQAIPRAITWGAGVLFAIALLYFLTRQPVKGAAK
jgi:hypothetical protein